MIIEYFKNVLSVFVRFCLVLSVFFYFFLKKYGKFPGFVIVKLVAVSSWLLGKRKGRFPVKAALKKPESVANS